MLGFMLGRQALLLMLRWKSRVSQTVGLVRQTPPPALVPLGCIPAACPKLLTSSRDGVAAPAATWRSPRCRAVSPEQLALSEEAATLKGCSVFVEGAVQSSVDCG